MKNPYRLEAIQRADSNETRSCTACKIRRDKVCIPCHLKRDAPPSHLHLEARRRAPGDGQTDPPTVFIGTQTPDFQRARIDGQCQRGLHWYPRL